MNRFKSFKPLSKMWFMALLLAVFVAGCGGGNGQGEIFGEAVDPHPNVPGGPGDPGPAGPSPFLGRADTFGIASTAGVNNTITTPITHINGDVVLDPNKTCNAVEVDNAGGFGLCNGMAPTINGTVITNLYPDTTTSTGIKTDLQAAFLDLCAPGVPAAACTRGAPTYIPINIPAGTTLGNVAGQPLVQGDNLFAPGLYQSITSILITDDLTLDAQNNPDAVFIFQSSSTIGTADGAASPGAHTRILLVNGAKASNVWWQASSSATLGTATEFQGNILSAASITMKTGATSCGRLFAGAFTDGAFVFDSNVVSVPGKPNAPPGCE